MTLCPNKVIIDLPAIVHNLGQVRKLVGPGVKIMGVVKSDAYGHGLIPVSTVLVDNNIDCLGVAHVFEAIELRQAQFKLPIVVLCGVSTAEECQYVVEYDLRPVLFDYFTLELLAQQAQSAEHCISFFLKVDTGMGRLGIPYDKVEAFVKKAMAFKSLKLVGLISHLSSADEKDSKFSQLQIERFQQAIKAVNSMGINLELNSMANSAGIMKYKQSHFDMVRPGIMLYGGRPSPGFIPPVALRPAMEFRAKVLQVRKLPDKTPVSYGRTHYTEGERTVAILSAGYGNGIPRSVSNRGNVLIDEEMMPIVGRVCMNLTICDITQKGNIRPGQEVIFLGRQGSKTISGDNIAGWSDSISYEIFCSIGQQNRREYRE